MYLQRKGNKKDRKIKKKGSERDRKKRKLKEEKNGKERKEKKKHNVLPSFKFIQSTETCLFRLVLALRLNIDNE